MSHKPVKLYLKHYILIGLLIIPLNLLTGQERGFVKGGADGPERGISEEQLRETEEKKLDFQNTNNLKTTIPAFLHDPVGNGGMNSFGKVITWYVDHYPGVGLRDYMCGQVTYNSYIGTNYYEHLGTDTGIPDFYEMDEGVPVLSAANGTVLEVHDGEYDKQWLFISRPGNYVLINHGQQYHASYKHLRKNSIRVSVGETVFADDTLGFIGSSGTAAFPHLHFQINDGIDPFQGPCQQDSSLWISQRPYTLNCPFEFWFDGLTTLILDWKTLLERPPSKTHVSVSDTIFSWIRCNYILQGDLLEWEIYANGSLFDSFSYIYTLTDVYQWCFFYRELPNDSLYFGNWQTKIYRNNVLLTEQNFIYDAQSNQVASIQDTTFVLHNDSKIQGEFTANDPDGSIFWYNIISHPINGQIKQYGGRKRNFIYTPNPGFIGIDTVAFYTLDDELAAGDTGFYYFNVSDNPNEIVRNKSNEIKTYHLAQNYPNPFNPVTNIEFEIAKTQLVTLRIYNTLGQEVAELITKQLAPGKYKYTWDASDFASGIYYYRLFVAPTQKNSDSDIANYNYVETKKLLLIK